MTRRTVVAVVAALLSVAAGWPLAPGDPSGNRVAAGHGSFPRRQALTFFVERWTLPLRGSIESNLVAADLDGDGLLDLAVADRRRLVLLLSIR